MDDVPPRRAAAEADPPPSVHTPQARRSADSPDDPPTIDSPAYRPQRSAPVPERAWLSLVTVPLVIALSIALALGARGLLGAEEQIPLIDPTTSPTAQPPSPSPTPEPRQVIELDDTSFTAPAHWDLVSDELIEDEYRAVRLTEPDTDIRLQAATLASTGEDLRETCQALVSLQSEAFSRASAAPVAPVTTTTEDQGISCGFDGIREADQTPNTVSFILLRRSTDNHLLMLRSTVPDNGADTSAARADLATMQCEASTGFGVPLPLC